MDTAQLKHCQEEMIRVGREAYQRGFIVARGGNISVRLNEQTFLMTAHTAALGFLNHDDFVMVDRAGKVIGGAGQPSTETKLHSAIYRDTDAGAVVHLHPPYTNVLAVRGIAVKPMTFESSLFLGPATPTVDQDSPSVTRLEGVMDALALSNIIILREHGTVAVGSTIWDAFFLTEILEEAALMSYLHETLGRSSSAEEGKTVPAEEKAVVTYPVFSKEHIEKIVSLVNEDEEAQRLGRSTHLTVKYAIKLVDTNQVYNFHFQEGEIIKVSTDEEADFVLSGKRLQWIAVFNGLIDPFAATTQKKLRLQKGSIGDLSRWYPPFYRVFALWKHAPVE